LLVRETAAVLVDYEQDDEQGGDQNDVSRPVHVVKDAVDFVHVCTSWELVYNLGALWGGRAKTEIARAYGRKKLGFQVGRGSFA
jgi:hypothetical protein